MRLHKVLSNETWKRLGVALSLFILPAFFFVELADEVRDKSTLQADEAILKWVNSYASPHLDVLTVGVTQLGGFIGVSVLSVGLALLLWRNRKRLMALFLLLCVGGASFINLLLKAFFQRDRPQLWERLVTENSYSFPSGHAMASSAFALSMIVIFWPTRYRWLVLALASLFMLVIGLTRLYLGVHYPTDVLAGWVVSGAWVGLMVLVVMYRKRITSSIPRKSL